MIVTDVREGERYAQTHLCPNCGQNAVLVVRWAHDIAAYEVYCPRCKATDGFTKPESLTAMWKRDPQSVPLTVANRLAHKHRKSIESETEGLPEDLAEAIRQKYLG